MLQAVLVDDEELSLEQLSYVLAGQAGVSIIGSYVDPIMAIEYIRNAKPDIVFVDVSMPCINGFQLVKEIVSESYHPYVVFVTAHSQYAINAFEVEAVDYVPKPIFKDRIEKALLKIRKRLNATPTHNIVKPANEITSKVKVDDLNCFPVEDNGAITLLDFNEVYYCTVDSKTTTVHTAKKMYTVATTLSKLEENYSTKPFFRCHKSFIVNLNHVEKIIPMFNQNHIIMLRNMKTEIPVSRHYLKGLKSILKLDTTR